MFFPDFFSPPFFFASKSKTVVVKRLHNFQVLNRIASSDSISKLDPILAPVTTKSASSLIKSSQQVTAWTDDRRVDVDASADDGYDSADDDEREDGGGDWEREDVSPGRDRELARLFRHFTQKKGKMNGSGFRSFCAFCENLRCDYATIRA